MAESTSRAPASQSRRHNIRGDGGKFAKAASPHHQVVQSTYERTQLSRAWAFTPDQAAAFTPQQETPR